jgi:hypothetical protein
VDTQKSSVCWPTVEGEDPHPHACWNGVVFMTYMSFDEEIGEEVEHLDIVPCRRCAEGEASNRE